MNQLNITHGEIPDMQTVNVNPSQDFLSRMITTLINNDNILNETINNNILNETINNEDTNTSNNFLNDLEEIEITDEVIKTQSECSICLESFKIGDKCIKLPCKDTPHYFHSSNENCPGIKNWLKNNNTCPLCRTEFPTETISQGYNNLIPNFTSSIILTPDQINGLNNTNINNIIPENNILSEDIINNIDSFIRNINDELNIQDDLQRTIELSLTDY